MEANRIGGPNRPVPDREGESQCTADTENIQQTVGSVAVPFKKTKNKVVGGLKLTPEEDHSR